MEIREPKLGVAVGRKGCGKTFTTTKMIKQYVLGNPAKGVPARRALILDVNDEFEDIKALKQSDIVRFSMHPKIEARRIRPYHDNGVRMTLREIQEVLFKILGEYRGGLLLIEDINRYISDYLPNDLVGAICTNRHSDTDIILHFQSIGRISPKIWQNLNWIRFHKITDDVIKHRNKFEEKLELLLLVEAYVNQQYENGDKRIFTYVDIDDEKVLLKDKKRFEKIIEDYLIANQNKVLKPLTLKNPLTATKPMTLQEALKFKTKQLMKQYVA